MRRVYMVVGFLSVAGGAFLIFMAFAFASMAEPDIQGGDRRAAILHSLTTGDGADVVGFGVFLVLSGAWVATWKTESDD